MLLIEKLSGLLPQLPQTDKKDFLADSIARIGIQSPILVVNNIIVDGHQRVSALKILGISEVPVITLEGDPWSLFWQLNLNRSWNLLETALVCKNIPDTELKDFFVTRGMKSSPHLQKGLLWVANHPEAWEQILAGSLSAAVLRDLAHLGTSMNAAFSLLLSISATAGEKRLIAGLLHRVVVKGIIPPFEQLAGLSASEVLTVLHSLVEPRKSAAMSKFTGAQSRIRWPKGLQLRVDPVFEKPGVSVQMYLKRNQLDRIRTLANGLQQLFEEVEEL